MQKNKFNWGWGIVLFFTCFVAFMIFMVYLTSTISHDLVTKDYYRQEIKYQDKIDMKNNLAKTGKHISVKNVDGMVIVSIPKINANHPEYANLYFYRPSDDKKDFHLKTHQDGLFIIAKNKIYKGAYIIKAQWECAGKKYYEEVNHVFL